jgi:hypothetical protein
MDCQDREKEDLFFDADWPVAVSSSLYINIAPAAVPGVNPSFKFFPLHCIGQNWLRLQDMQLLPDPTKKVQCYFTWIRFKVRTPADGLVRQGFSPFCKYQ